MAVFDPKPTPTSFEIVLHLKADNCWGYFLVSERRIGEMAKMDGPTFEKEVTKFKSAFVEQLGSELSDVEKDRLFISSFTHTAERVKKKREENEQPFHLVVLPHEAFQNLTKKNNTKQKARTLFEETVNKLAPHAKSRETLYQEFRTQSKTASSGFYLETSIFFLFFKQN